MQPQLFSRSDIPKRSHSMLLRTRAAVVARRVNCDLHDLAKELLECTIGEIEDIAAAHAEFSLQLLLLDVRKVAHSLDRLVGRIVRFSIATVKGSRVITAPRI